MRPERIGFAMCGSFCTFKRAFAELERLCGEYETVIPIFSETSGSVDSRFGEAADFLGRAEALCGRPVLRTLSDVEPIGPKQLLDLLVVMPCTGNTIAKLANGIADSSVTLACKAHLRNEAPIVLAVSSNDALGGNAANIGKLLGRKHFYFVPFGQDDPAQKPCSLVADFTMLSETVAMALEGRQLQPLLLRA